MKKTLIFGALLLSTLSVAAPPAVTGPQTIDVLQDKLYKQKKLPAAISLKKAFEALEAGKPLLARKFAGAALKDPTFSDYALWLLTAINAEDAGHALKNKQYATAQRLAQDSIDKALKIQLTSAYSPHLKNLSKELAQAEVTLGLASCGLKKWRACRESLESAFQRLSPNDLGLIKAPVLVTYGLACSKEKPETVCQPWMQRLWGFFPKNSGEIKALATHGKPVLDLLKPAPGFARATRQYKAPDPDLVAFDTAMGLYLDGKFKSAAVSFRQFQDDYPKSTYRYRAQYWLAQAYEREGRTDEARVLLEELQKSSPLTYYGLLATLATGKRIGEWIDATMPVASPTDPFMSALEAYRIARAEKFLAARALPLARIELKEIRPRSVHSNEFLLYLALLHHESGYHPGAFSVLTELFQRGYEGARSSFALRLIFPISQMDLIEKYAAENKLDPILVLSLIKQESGFDPGVASGAGAQGLMQVMPATALEVFPEIARSELTLAESNVRTGTKYLAKLLTRYNGNIALSLAAYNAGPTAVDRWVKASPQRGLLEFVETIPYRETREYVAAIIRHHFWYTRALKSEAPTTLSYFWDVYGPQDSAIMLQPVVGPSPTATPSPEEDSE